MNRYILTALLALSVSACEFTAEDAARLLAQVNETISRVERMVATVTASYAQAEGVVRELRDVATVLKGEPHPCAGVVLPLPKVADEAAQLWDDAVLYQTRQGTADSWAVAPYGVGVAPVHTPALKSLCACLTAIYGGVGGYSCAVLVGKRQGWSDCGPTIDACASAHWAVVQ